MAWNKPGSGKQDDPWGKKKTAGEPPELDQLFAELQKKIRSLLRKKPDNFSPSSNGLTIGILVVIGVLIWALSGIFVVDPAERAVIQRFGKYIETVGPGLHWIPRFISTKTIVNEEEISNYSYSSHMLTKDENIVSVAVAIQYRIDNAKDYLFNVMDPQESIRQATASALRQVVGHTTLDNILTKGREQVRQEVSQQLNEILALYHVGLSITNVAMQPVRPPEEVKEAFDDAIKAQEDEQRFINEAHAYKMRVEPIAEGQVARLLREANAYKQEVVLRAQGDVARFSALLSEYKKAPEIMRRRLYLVTLEQVLAQTPKILIDAQSTNNLVYLPLEQLLNKHRVPKATVDSKGEQAETPSTAGAASSSVPGKGDRNTILRLSRDELASRMGTKT